MKVFKSIADINQLPPDHPSHPLILELVSSLIDAYSYQGHSYHPDDDGYVVLLEEQDGINLDSGLLMGYASLLEVPWEGVSFMGGHFYALYLANNQFGIGFVIPDAPWLDSRLRSVLMEHLDPELPE